MSLRAGTKLGSYEILGELGSGGMGSVYRARDTRLNRTVAIKIPHDPISERTRREARALAALNHPNICQIYDVGELPSGASYLVVEYLEGETLAARIDRGPIPMDEALDLAGQIAAALEASHRAGIVHRDLKPANIVLTKSALKVLDFGLVRLADAPGEDAATVTAITSPGHVVGTLQYMAPEQLEGKEAGVPADVFAFGAVVYEMLTGKRAFDSPSRAGIVAAILTGPPPALSSALSTVPPPLETLIRSCLAREPEERWQSAHDISLALTSIAAHHATAVPATSPKRSPFRRAHTALWALATLLVAAATWLAASYLRTTGPPAPQLRTSLLPPPSTFFELGHFAISPDGTRVVFVAVGADGVPFLWIRSLSAPGAQRYEAAAEAAYPFWSPDGSQVGFFANRKLKALDIATGNVRTICDAPLSRGGGAWSPLGVIVFARANSGPLYRVQEKGGTPVPATKLPGPDSGQSHRWPVFLPDGKTFLYLADWSGPGDRPGDGIYAATLESSEPRSVSPDIHSNVAFADGHLIYSRDRSLRAQPFNARTLELPGEAISIVEQEVTFHAGISHGAFSVSQGGLVIFQSLADASSRLTWLDPSGKEIARIAEFGYSQPRISPDGRSVVVVADEERNGKWYVRVFDVESGQSSRITDSGAEDSPSWTVDGRFITYSRFDGKTWHLQHVPADRSAEPRVLRSGPPMRHPEWSPLGYLALSDFSAGAPVTRVLRDEGRTDTGFKLSPGAEARFSPDGNWLAYVGAGGVWVVPFPGPGPRIQVSPAVASQPVWSRDGRRIYFIQPDRKLMYVAFDATRKTVGVPQLVTRTRVVATNMAGTQYDVAPDGRILINSMPTDHASPLTLLFNWQPRK